MTKEAYCSFKVAELLKKKGFEQHCCAHSYDSNGVFKWSDDLDPYEYSAPTHQMACAWLREKGYHIYTFQGVDYWVFEIQSLNEDWTYSLGVFKEHDDAMEAALKYSLENLI